jgi:nucleoside-diphosphate-sugar epimerase
VQHVGAAAVELLEQRRELGYNPAVDLQAGIARTAAWYRSQGLL